MAVPRDCHFFLSITTPVQSRLFHIDTGSSDRTWNSSLAGGRRVWQDLEDATQDTNALRPRAISPLSRHDPPVTGARASCPRTSRHLPLFDRIAKNTVCDGLSEVEGRMPSLPGTPTTPVPNQFLTWTAVTKIRGPILTLRNDFQENRVLSHPRSSLPI